MSTTLVLFAGAAGGFVGGITSAVVIVLLVRAFGRREAERLVREQLGVLEQRFNTVVVDGVLAKIARFLDQSERLGQIAQRVIEIARLVWSPQPLPPASPLASAHATLGGSLLQLGRHDEARRAFEEAIKLDPTQPTALAGLRSLDGK
jgi:hypothetical protein